VQAVASRASDTSQTNAGSLHLQKFNAAGWKMLPEISNRASQAPARTTIATAFSAVIWHQLKLKDQPLCRSPASPVRSTGGLIGRPWLVLSSPFSAAAAV
jgi:hypothetical protein